MTTKKLSIAEIFSNIQGGKIRRQYTSNKFIIKILGDWDKSIYKRVISSRAKWFLSRRSDMRSTLISARKVRSSYPQYAFSPYIGIIYYSEYVFEIVYIRIPSKLEIFLYKYIGNTSYIYKPTASNSIILCLDKEDNEVVRDLGKTRLLVFDAMLDPKSPYYKTFKTFSPNSRIYLTYEQQRSITKDVYGKYIQLDTRISI